MRHLRFALLVIACACGSGQNEADRRGVGAACSASAPCTEAGQSCLTEFKGGYAAPSLPT